MAEVQNINSSLLHVDEILFVVKKKNNWMGRSVAAFPNLLPSLNFLLGSHSAAEFRVDLERKLMQIYLGISKGTLANDSAGKEVQKKIHELLQHLKLPIKVTETVELEIEKVEFDDLSALLAYLETVKRDSVGRSLGPDTVHNLKKLIIHNESLLGLSEEDDEDAKKILRVLKDIDFTLFKNCFLYWQNTGLNTDIRAEWLLEVCTTDEILTLAPFLTRITFSGDDLWRPEVLKEKFIGNFLERATGLSFLRVEGLANFTGACLVKAQNCLISIDISNCSRFDHAIPAHVHKASIESCPSFNPFSHNPHTVVAYCNGFLRLNDPQISEKEEEMRQNRDFQQNLHNFLLEFADREELFFLDVLKVRAIYKGEVEKFCQYKKGSYLAIAITLQSLHSLDQVQLTYLYLKNQNCLEKTLRAVEKRKAGGEYPFSYFPQVCHFLQEHNQDITKDIESKDKALRLELLRYLTPDLIRKTVFEFSEEERKGWLTSKDELTRMVGLTSLKDRMPASVNGYDWGLLLPVVSLKTFIQFIDSFDIRVHDRFFSNATTEQLEGYMQQDLFGNTFMNDWHRLKKDLERTVRVMQVPISDEHVAKLLLKYQDRCDDARALASNIEQFRSNLNGVHEPMKARLLAYLDGKTHLKQMIEDELKKFDQAILSHKMAR